MELNTRVPILERFIIIPLFHVPSAAGEALRIRWQ
jgi:hypothetical protein